IDRHSSARRRPAARDRLGWASVDTRRFGGRVLHRILVVARHHRARGRAIDRADASRAQSGNARTRPHPRLAGAGADRDVMAGTTSTTPERMEAVEAVVL